MKRELQLYIGNFVAESRPKCVRQSEKVLHAMLHGLDGDEHGAVKLSSFRPTSMMSNRGGYTTQANFHHFIVMHQALIGSIASLR